MPAQRFPVGTEIWVLPECELLAKAVKKVGQVERPAQWTEFVGNADETLPEACGFCVIAG
jgi:hypothetical protein